MWVSNAYFYHWIYKIIFKINILKEGKFCNSFLLDERAASSLYITHMLLLNPCINISLINFIIKKKDCLESMHLPINGKKLVARLRSLGYKIIIVKF